jgi:hypothetical protein
LAPVRALAVQHPHARKCQIKTEHGQHEKERVEPEHEQPERGCADHGNQARERPPRQSVQHLALRSGQERDCPGEQARQPGRNVNEDEQSDLNVGHQYLVFYQYT